MRTRYRCVLAAILIFVSVPPICNETLIERARAWDGVTAAASTASSQLEVVIPPLFEVSEQQGFSIEYRGSSVCIYSLGDSREFRISTQAVADRDSKATRPITYSFEGRAAGRTALSCAEKPGFGAGTRIRIPDSSNIARRQLRLDERLLIALEPI